MGVVKVHEVLHMNEGTGGASYSNNSFLQRKVISMTKPIAEQALTNMYSATNFPTTINVADLGCSSGPNTLLVVSDLIKTVNKISLKTGRESPEIQIYLNDLPGNDFNTIFRSLAKFHQGLTKRMEYCNFSIPPSYYVTGVPGSFYTRLFPRKSLHFVHSSYSLQWLSQVPQVGDTNKGNIFMSSTSPPSVLKAYHEQFQNDFSMFLKCRAEEMVGGGRMVLTILGRRSDDPSSKECCHIYDLLALALNDMVFEGVIEEGKMDSFNIPEYMPCAREVKEEVEKEGSFAMDRVEVSAVDWDECMDHNNLNGFKKKEDGGYDVAKCMRAVVEPLLVSHFGEAVMEEVFERYRKIIADRMSKEHTEFINVTVSLTRKM